jgi:hypothetical protein
MEAAERGITLELTPEAAESLRSRRILPPTSVISNDDNDNWNEVLTGPILPSHESDNSETIPQGELSSVRDKHPQEDEDDDSLSLSPPPHLPVVRIDLERLVGYRPCSELEARQVRLQVRAALWGLEDVDGAQEGDNADALASDFDDRVAELLETRVAVHGTTIDKNQEVDRSSTDSANLVSNRYRYAIIDYPEYLCERETLSSTDDNRPTDDPDVRVYSTARIWKRLLQPHRVSVVDRLLRHVTSCNRGLLWKHAMREELVRLARDEEHARVARQQTEELLLWKTDRRQSQLDKLYSVRETLEHRIDLAQSQLRELEGAREVQVQTQLEAQRLDHDTQLDGFSALDWSSSAFGFPSDSKLEDCDLFGLRWDEDDFAEDEEYTLLSEHEDNDDESLNESDCDHTGEKEGSDDSTKGSMRDDTSGQEPPRVAVDEAPLALPVQTGDTKSRRRLATRKRRHLLRAHAEGAEREARVRAAKEEEEAVRDGFTSTELKLASALVQSLQGKMAQVDNLLETIQEEEWQDEEEGITELLLESKGSGSTPDGMVLSLLDQILAMVLGATLPGDQTLLDEHVLWLRDEHRSIATEWQAYFGRLPAPLTGPDDTFTSPTVMGEKTEPAVRSEPDNLPMTPDRQSVLRQALGIVEHDTVDWEDEESDCVDTVGCTTNPAVAHAGGKAIRTRAPTSGLRPGGRL